ncbi:MAG: 16S rRNA (cytidine(1402)-2'-O)-methyltransferase [Alphaproteobacteria bacterium]
MIMDDIEKVTENPEASVHLKSGLYVVATPIGNLRDISLRALEVLRNCDVIMCEDTRVTRKLLNAYQIKGKLCPYNDHSDDARRQYIVDQVKGGQVVALVSDAGMPLISDPGYKLVRDCEEGGVYVTTIPGASAPLAALQISGLPSDRFCFIGFLPHKTNARKKLLSQWCEVPGTLIAFETAPRLLASLQDIDSALGVREVAVVREITKLYEEVRKGSPSDLCSHYEKEGLPRGEIVLVISPPEDVEITDDEVFDMIRDALKSMRTKDAAAFVAEKVGRKKNDLYDIALQISKE